MSKKVCKTDGCSNVAKSRGVCTKCYGTLRVYVQKGKITWEKAVELGLCQATNTDDSAGESPMLGLLQGLNLPNSSLTPAFDPDQEPPLPELDALGPKQEPATVVTMPVIDESPQGYANFDPKSKPAPKAPEPPRRQLDDPVPEPIDPLDAIEDVDDYDETPDQKKRRASIERRWKREQRDRYVEEHGFEPPTNGKVVVVRAPIADYQLNADPMQQVMGVGAGNPPPANRPPGVYVEPHAEAAQQTIDGEPLLPGWQLHPDGVNLIAPNGQVVNTDPRIRAQQLNMPNPPQAPPLILPGQRDEAPASGEFANGTTDVIPSDSQPIVPPGVNIMPESNQTALVADQPVVPAQPDPNNMGLVPQGPIPMNQSPWRKES